MTSLMDDFLSSGAIAYPSTNAAKKMLKDIPELSHVTVANLRTGLRSKLSTKTPVSKIRDARE